MFGILMAESEEESPEVTSAEVQLTDLKHMLETLKGHLEAVNRTEL